MVVLSFILLVAAILCTLIYSKYNKAQKGYPRPTELMYINDYAGIIDDNTKSKFVNLGKELQDKTSAQAVIVVVKSLKGENIDKYANGLFNQWGIGQKDKNNGLLILVSLEDRKWRVEIGSGLEKIISDKYSSNVMNDMAVPYFKQNMYGDGLFYAYSVLATDIANHYGAKLGNSANITYNQNSKDSAASGGIPGKSILAVIFVIIVVILILRRKGPGRPHHNFGSYNFYSSSGESSSWNNSSGDSGDFGGGSSDGGGSSGDW